MRLQSAYAGDKADDIQRRESEVLEAWRSLLEACDGRRLRLLDTGDKFRFFSMVRDLMLWMEDVIRLIEAQENPRYTESAAVCWTSPTCNLVIVVVNVCVSSCVQRRVISGAADEQPSRHQGGDRCPKRQLHSLHRAGQSPAGPKTLRFRGGEEENNPLKMVDVQRVSRTDTAVCQETSQI